MDNIEFSHENSENNFIELSSDIENNRNITLKKKFFENIKNNKKTVKLNNMILDIKSLLFASTSFTIDQC